MGAGLAIGRLGGADAIVRVLQKTTAMAIAQYEESHPNQKVPEPFKKVLDRFIEMYVGTMINAILTGRLEKSAARTALVQMFKMAGIADESSMVDCGVGLFIVGVTAYESLNNTVKATRVAGIAAASGIGAGPGALLVVATFTYGVFITFKDGMDATNSCNEALSKYSERSKKPAATIDGKGYGLGPLSIHIRIQRGPSTKLMS